jgi:hypothetical protein
MANVNRGQGRITDKDDKQQSEQEMVQKGATSNRNMSEEKEEVVIGQEEMAEVKKPLVSMQKAHSDLKEVIETAHSIALKLPNSDHLSNMLSHLNNAAVELQRYIEELEEVERLTE